MLYLLLSCFHLRYITTIATINYVFFDSSHSITCTFDIYERIAADGAFEEFVNLFHHLYISSQFAILRRHSLLHRIPYKRLFL